MPRSFSRVSSAHFPYSGASVAGKATMSRFGSIRRDVAASISVSLPMPSSTSASSKLP